MVDKSHYVYSHFTDDYFKPFYIGKGSGNRCKDGTKGRNTEWHQITDEHGGFNWRILMDGLSKSEAHELEMLVIETYGRDTLTNWNGKHSEETKRKMSNARKAWHKRKQT